MPYPCCGPHCSVCRMSMSSVPCSSSIRFLYWSFSFIDVDTLPPVAVDCLLPHHGGASIQAVLIATPQMRSESGLTFRSKQSAVWPADHAVGAAAASQQERLATCPDSTQCLPILFFHLAE